ncbi:hypothetical protein IWW40_001766 [Coemansia sp. RSA 1250]|nr:hypothetical protein IWW40_001766 [Coemansia sp. RSA 1250]
MKLFKIATAVALIYNAQTVGGDCSFDEISVESSPGFTISIEKEYKVLEDTRSQMKYGLYCDSQPSNVDGIDRWFKVPVSSVGVRIPLASGFLEALGHRDTLKAAESPGNLTNICLGNIQPLESSTVDIVFSTNTTSDGEKTVALPADDTLTPLQKAEWIKFVAAFYNDEKAASSLYSSISAAYECHWSNLQHLAQQPHAYWVQYADKQPQIIDSAYQKSLLAGAGATNDTKEPLSDPTDPSKFQEAIKDADFVFDQTFLTEYGQRASEWYEKFAYPDPQNSGASFLRSRNIWRTDGYTSKDGVSNFPEFGYVRPDLVLQDIISVMEPTYEPKYQRRWMLWLGGTNENTVVIDSSNYNCDSPWITQVAKCEARTDFTGEDGSSSDSSSDSSSSDDEGKSEGSSGRAGKIAGGVVAAAAVIALAVVALHYYNKRRRNLRIQALAQQAEFGGHSPQARRFS